jgi:hypothetical protein
MNKDPMDQRQQKPEDKSHTYDVLKKHLPLNRPPEHFDSKEDQSRIEELKKKLYSKSMTGIDHVRRQGLHSHSSLVGDSWSHEEENTPKVEVYPYASNRRVFTKRLFLFSIFLFIIALGYGAFELISGNNFISSSNIDLTITGPVTISSGEDLVMDIDIKNRNSSDLELADLVMTYPEGTRKAADNTQTMVSDRISIGTIKAGETIQKRIQVTLFGEEGSNKSISAALEYRVPGSTSIFRKQKDIAMAIGNSPVGLSINSASQITSGQNITLDLTIKSNSAQLLKGVLLKAHYPFGFKFTSATPVPGFNSDTWNLGDIAPNSEQKIKIIGTINSDSNQERDFKFDIGTINTKDENQIGTIFVSTNKTLLVSEPFIATDLTINGSSEKNTPINAGDNVQAEVTWKNNLDVPIQNVTITAKLTGGFLDRTSINADPGFFRSEDNTIVWNKSTIDALSEVKAGGSGRVVFHFSSFKPAKDNVGSIKNPAITVELSVQGTRLNENDVQEDIKTGVTKTAQVRSEAVLKTGLVRTVGPFTNTGPFPAVAEKSTTFTQIVKISNSYNTIKNGIYTTSLPDYVSWTGQVYPKTAVVSFDPLSRSITWKVGDIPPGTGYSSPAKEVAFQVSLRPSLSQSGTTPIIINNQSLNGTDGFTGQAITTSDSTLNTNLANEPTYVYGQDRILAK